MVRECGSRVTCVPMDAEKGDYDRPGTGRNYERRLQHQRIRQGGWRYVPLHSARRILRRPQGRGSRWTAGLLVELWAWVEQQRPSGGLELQLLRTDAGHDVDSEVAYKARAYVCTRATVPR